MSQVQLRPTAAPFDLFSPGPTQVRANAGSGLLETARALSSFSNDLRAFAAQASQDTQQASAAEAQALQAERRFKSLKDLKAAVDAGQLHEDDNPWKMAFLKKLVARGMFLNSRFSIEDEYRKDKALWAADTVAPVDQFLTQKISTITEGMGPWELEAVAPAAEEFRQSFLMQHQAEGRRRRDAETEAGFQRNLAAEYRAALPLLQRRADAEAFPNAPRFTEEDAKILETYTKRIQFLTKTAEQVTPKEKVRAWAQKAIADLAIETGDVDSAEEMLSSVKVAGESIKDEGLLEAIRRKVSDRDIEKMRDEQFRDAVSQERAFKEAQTLLVTRREEIAKETGKPVNSFDITVPLDRLNGESLLKLQQLREALNSDTATRELSRFLTATSGRTPSASEEASFYELQVLGQPGLVAIENYKRFGKLMKEQSWGEDTPQGLAQLAQLYSSPASPREKIDTITGMAERREVSESTFKRYIDSFAAPKTTQVTDGILRTFSNQLESQLSLAAQLRPGMVDEETGRLTPAAEFQIRNALGRFNLEALSWIDANHATGFDAPTLEKALANLTNKWVSTGGMTSAEVQSILPYTDVVLRVNRGEGIPGQDIRWDPESRSLSMVLGNTLRPLPGAMPRFADVKDFETRGDSIAEAYRVPKEERFSFFATAAGDNPDIAQAVVLRAAKESMDERSLKYWRDNVKRIEEKLAVAKSDLDLLTGGAPRVRVNPLDADGRPTKYEFITAYRAPTPLEVQEARNRYNRLLEIRTQLYGVPMSLIRQKAKKNESTRSGNGGS